MAPSQTTRPHPPLLRLFLPFLVRALLGTVVLAAPGCLLQSAEMARTRHAFERQYPAAQFDRQVAFDLGPLTMAMGAGLVRRWAPEAFELTAPYLRHTRHLELGVYSVRGLPPLERVDAARLPVMRQNGWETVVRVREKEEHVWVLARPERRALDALYVLVLSADELVSVHVEGDLQKMVTFALKEHGALLDWADTVPPKADRHAEREAMRAKSSVSPVNEHAP